jgi:hypothetical protein
MGWLRVEGGRAVCDRGCLVVWVERFWVSCESLRERFDCYSRHFLSFPPSLVTFSAEELLCLWFVVCGLCVVGK